MARDPLFITSNKPCPTCWHRHWRKRRRLRKRCDDCKHTGWQRASLEGFWTVPGAGFLVCGGPSLRTLDVNRLNDRGIVSLGVNNVAGFAPVKAWTFSDPQYKFHSGVFLDPNIMTFAPTPKLGKHIRIKHPDHPDGFTFTNVQVWQCPNTWGYSRRTELQPEKFLETEHAHWGWGGSQGEDREFTQLNTMFLGLRLIHYLGIRMIFLLGVDFKRADDAWYAWGQDKHGGGGIWRKSNELFARMRPYLEHAGVRIYNCNPASALDVFPYVSYDEALEACRGAVPRGSLDLNNWYNKGPVKAARELHKQPGYKHYDLAAQISKSFDWNQT